MSQFKEVMMRKDTVGLAVLVCMLIVVLMSIVLFNPALASFLSELATFVFTG